METVIEMLSHSDLTFFSLYLLEIPLIKYL